MTSLWGFRSDPSLNYSVRTPSVTTVRLKNTDELGLPTLSKTTSNSEALGSLLTPGRHPPV